VLLQVSVSIIKDIVHTRLFTLIVVIVNLKFTTDLDFLELKHRVNTLVNLGELGTLVEHYFLLFKEIALERGVLD